ncbi:hypothetical protein BN903_9 [Halorubrum sp. AJ67]|nr:hypothetical protein BN903_9 [Halorubrum sp. AJ67]
MTDRFTPRGAHGRHMPSRDGLLGVQTSIIGLAILELFGEVSGGFLVGIAVLLYGSYLVGRNRKGPAVRD